MVILKNLISKLAIFIGALATISCTSAPSVGPSFVAASESGASGALPIALIECPDRPNCVSSVTTDSSKRVAAFEVKGQDVAIFQAQLEQILALDGGVVKDKRDGYLWATYTSSVFRFVDDIEWLYDLERDQFDVRSASRTGYSDLGVNKKRVERLRIALESLD